MDAAWAPLLGCVLVTVGAVTSIPQIAQLLRTRATDGLSPATQMLWALTRGLWLFYALEISLPLRAASEATSLLGEAAILGCLFAGLARHGTARTIARSLLPLLVSVLAAVAVARWQFGITGYAVALTGVDLLSLVPILRTLRAAPSLDGVSAPMWALKGATYLGWIVYGAMVGQPLSAGRMFFMAPLAAYVLVRILADRGTPAWVTRGVERATTLPIVPGSPARVLLRRG